MTRAHDAASRRLAIGGRQTEVRVRVANTFWSRARGLLGYAPLSVDEALWIVPCNSVHTVGMSYPIDVLFLDRDLRVVRIARGLRGMRVAIARRAHSTLEMSSGAVDALGIEEGMGLGVSG